MKCKNVRENILERGRKVLKCMRSDELFVVMGIFSARWRKFWKEVSIIVIMYLLVVYVKSLYEFNFFLSFNIKYLIYFKIFGYLLFDFLCFGLFLLVVLNLYNYSYN